MFRSTRLRTRGFWLVWLAWSAIALSSPKSLKAQSSIGFGSVRPFVVGFRPVVGRGGAVGGVAIDAHGVVSRVDQNVPVAMTRLRETALGSIESDDLFRHSKLRKISLGRLNAVLSKFHREAQQPTSGMQYLAGLQRVEYVFVYPGHQDIVLAGKAEGWRMSPTGIPLGVSTGTPPLQLDDLLGALRSAENDMSCSIDPSEEGLMRLRRLLRSRRVRMSENTIRQMEEALGPQTVTISGVPPGSHFARIMLAADVRMKSLAMGFETAPMPTFSNYMQMLQSHRRIPRNVFPRWWLAANYEPMLTDGKRMAWQLRGEGVRVLTEDSYFTSTGAAVPAGKSHPVADAWARQFTENYAKLSRHLPIFGQLRNCMDLAVVGALVVKEGLVSKSGCKMEYLLNTKLVQVTQDATPQEIASQSSFFASDDEWVICISGGVEIDGRKSLEYMDTDAKLIHQRLVSRPPPGDRWWWD